MSKNKTKVYTDLKDLFQLKEKLRVEENIKREKNKGKFPISEKGE